jgi:hypothetical protein
VTAAECISYPIWGDALPAIVREVGESTTCGIRLLLGVGALESPPQVRVGLDRVNLSSPGGINRVVVLEGASGLRRLCRASSGDPRMAIAPVHQTPARAVLAARRPDGFRSLGSVVEEATAGRLLLPSFGASQYNISRK